MALDGSAADYYRERAHKARALATKAHDMKIRVQFETVALQWEMLAFEVEAQMLKR